jgi:hypothetical protein
MRRPSALSDKRSSPPNPFDLRQKLIVGKHCSESWVDPLPFVSLFVPASRPWSVNAKIICKISRVHLWSSDSTEGKCRISGVNFVALMGARCEINDDKFILSHQMV